MGAPATLPRVSALAPDTGVPAGVAQRAYWGRVGSRWIDAHPDRPWRCCSDAVHTRWMSRIAADLRGGRVLKTDLFNEAIGDGFTGWFVERGCRVMACDVAGSTAAGAAARHPSIAATVADVRDLPFPSGSLDAVLSDSTLDHFDDEEDIARSLRELRRVIRPGGTLLLTMDNPRNPLIWLRNLRPRFWHRLGLVPYMVGVTCSRRRLADILEAAGFKVESCGTIMHAPRVVVVALCRWIAALTGNEHPPVWLMRSVLGAERLERLPTRELTGHFVAVRARAR